MKTPIPLTTGLLHFIGIGGIGMSGMAEVLANLGYKVQGSDAADSYNLKRLNSKGINTFVGHNAANIKDAAAVIASSAIKPDNPELLAARAARIPVVKRPDMLAEIVRLKWSVAVAGTHGKTTTTTMVAALLDAAGLDPTVINGGIINAYGSNTRLGGGDWVVVEADESDGTFLKLRSTVAIVTNIDPEHLDYYHTAEALYAAFEQFIQNLPFYGLAVLCLDHPAVQHLLPKIIDRRVVTYGFNPQADIRADNVRLEAGVSRFDVVFSDGERWTDLALPMAGQHNVSNALAALAVARHLGADTAAIRKGMEGFSGVKRRFTQVGVAGGITVIDDYGHHPVEIAAVLKAARQLATGRVIAVVQPHRYSRVSALWADFAACVFDADTVLLAPIYEAGEQPLDGISHTTLAEAMRQHGHKDVVLTTEADLPGQLNGLARSGDYVVCLGAGSISAWAQALPDKLTTLAAKHA